MTYAGEDSGLVGVLQQSLRDTAGASEGRSWATFTASTLGHCPRQTYLTHLGLRDSSDWQGKFLTRRLLQDHLADALEAADRPFEVGPHFSVRGDSSRITGRPTCYDPETETVYHVKPRDGWYKFNPPVDRHLRQLQVYLEGLDADRGQLVYVSMSDLTDIRVWPDDDHDDQFLARDTAEADRIIAKADAIHREIVANGIATEPEAIPYEPCGCYLCETETLALPAVDAAGSATSPAPAPTEDPFSTGSELAARADAGTTVEAADGGQPAVDSEFEWVELPADDDDSERLLVDDYHVPAPLKQLDVWVVWNCEDKRPLAPWDTGHMFPCEWAASKDVDPRTSWDRAQMVAELPVERIAESWPFPDDDRPETVKPAVLLPHSPPDPPVTFVDFDDVRDPDTGRVTGEAVELLEALGAYVEVSASGRGLHAYVRAELPDGPVQASLRNGGSVELYDRSRMTAGTWRHVEGTPRDAVPEAQAAVERIIRSYD